MGLFKNGSFIFEYWLIIFDEIISELKIKFFDKFWATICFKKYRA